MSERYKFDSLKALMYKAFMMGCYSGKHDLLKITMKGDFEGFSGRASETWEQHFFVEFRKPEGDDPVLYPEVFLTSHGHTIEEACHKILKQLEERSKQCGQ